MGISVGGLCLLDGFMCVGFKCLIFCLVFLEYMLFWDFILGLFFSGLGFDNW